MAKKNKRVRKSFSKREVLKLLREAMPIGNLFHYTSPFSAEQSSEEMRLAGKSEGLSIAIRLVKKM